MTSSNPHETSDDQQRRRAVLAQIVDLLTEHADLIGPKPSDPDDPENVAQFVGPMICTGIALGAQWADLGAVDNDPESPTSTDWVVSSRNGMGRAQARGIALDMVDGFG